ncbi:MAG: tetratricopeptide repeat protein [Akkermansia sp.]
MQGSLDKLKPLSPRTRWMIVGILTLIVGGLQYGTFRLGYNQGWKEGAATPPKYVIEQSDEKAMETLSRFMAESASGPDALAGLVKNRKDRLSWIRNAELRADVSWGLGRELMVDGRTDDAIVMVDELINEGFQSGKGAKWASRAEFTGNTLMNDSHPQRAVAYYQKAAEGFALSGNQDARIRAMELQSSALIAANKREEALKILKEICDIASKDVKNGANSEKGRALQSRSLATMGRLARGLGKSGEARDYFAQALKLWPSGSGKGGEAMGSARICMGEALLESGRKDEAERLFEQGLESLQGSRADLSYQLSALRGLSQIHLAKGNMEESLSSLYQAEGLAKGTLPLDDGFWSCLYDQRGWVQMMRGKPDEAMKDFTRAIKGDSTPEAKMQSCEGLGSAYVEKGDGEKAQKYLNQAVELREKHLPNDAPSLARVYKSLGASYDLTGKEKESFASYHKALEYLIKAHVDTRSPQFIETALCTAYTLMDLKEWQQAVEAFDFIIPSLEGEKKSETYKKQAQCYDSLNMRAKGDDCWRLSGFPRISSPIRRLRR